jgi:hypothetical protein
VSQAPKLSTSVPLLKNLGEVCCGLYPVVVGCTTPLGLVVRLLSVVFEPPRMVGAPHLGSVRGARSEWRTSSDNSVWL